MSDEDKMDDLVIHHFVMSCSPHHCKNYATQQSNTTLSLLSHVHMHSFHSASLNKDKTSICKFLNVSLNSLGSPQSVLDMMIYNLSANQIQPLNYISSLLVVFIPVDKCIATHLC